METMTRKSVMIEEEVHNNLDKLAKETKQKKKDIIEALINTADADEVIDKMAENLKAEKKKKK
jgi:predicted transcriptional regulator